MMCDLGHLFERNEKWAERIREDDPGFFAGLAEGQEARYLWIGCSDSRVPASCVVDVLPGEMFVHRNVGNVVAEGDLNCLSVIEYAVGVLKVGDVIVCGHYGCGAVRAAWQGQGDGVIGRWLGNIRAVYARHRERIDALAGEKEKLELLCELNVGRQVVNVCRSAAVEAEWAGGRELAVHGWIYSIEEGRVRDLKISVRNRDELADMVGTMVGGAGCDGG